MSKLFFYFLFFFVLVNSLYAIAQSENPRLIDLSTKGIEISQKTFDLNVRKELVALKKNCDLSISQMINVVRLYNTIIANPAMQTDVSNSEFIDLCIDRYLNKIIIGVDAKLTKGMGYYSKKYNLYLGGQLNYNSLFTIIKNK